jgi:hypothetical protein
MQPCLFSVWSIFPLSVSPALLSDLSLKTSLFAEFSFVLEVIKIQVRKEFSIPLCQLEQFQVRPWCCQIGVYR